MNGKQSRLAIRVQANGHGRVLAQAARRGAQAAVSARELPAAEMTIVLADDATLRGMNSQWRGKDIATDVLSFPASEDGLATQGPGEVAYLGDVVVSVETATAQAERAGRSPESELRLLAAHGTLHLLGYRDDTDAGRDEMYAEERRIGVRAPEPA